MSEWEEGTYAVSSPREMDQPALVGIMVVLFSAGSNQDVPFERLSGEKRLFWTEVGKSTPVIFSSAYARIMYAALE